MARRLFRVAVLGAVAALLVGFVNLVPGLFLLTALLGLVVWLGTGVVAVLWPPRISTVRGAAGFAALAGLAATLLNTALVLVVVPLVVALQHETTTLVANAGPGALAAAQQLGLDPVRFPGVLLVYAMMMKDALLPALLLNGFLALLGGVITALILRRGRPRPTPARQGRGPQMIGGLLVDGLPEYLEAQRQVEAARPRAGWFDDAIANLVGIYNQYPQGFLADDDRPAVRELRRVGQLMADKGGMDLMRAAHHEFAKRCSVYGAARNLEIVWDGIGEWHG